ncbi:hypothetical protein FQR65_LT18048 [Abscondita terminalis]|nr:hypothetical protein FQR65_LT18048 [Abscondita terminalis]
MNHLFVVLGLFIAKAGGRQLPPDVKKIWLNLSTPHQDECITLSGTDPALVTMITEEAYVADVRSLGCYLMCTYKKLEFLLIDGNFVSHQILSKASYMTDPFTTACIDEASGEVDLCLKSLIAGNCTISGLSLP